MEIRGKVHLLFEQSGTFKAEFKKLGYEAFDYDIQDAHGCVDYRVDLFGEIDSAYMGGVSCFDSITYDDLIIAFFPCIYFCATSQIAFTYGCYNYRRLNVRGKTEAILSRSLMRERYYSLLLKLICVCSERGLRLIVENPWGEQTYLKNNFVLPPSYVDTDRTRRGDYFVKPTAYWFINCVPEHGFTPQRDKPRKRILETRRGKRAGVCSEERSAISPDYARNFICDNILGVGQSVGGVQMTLF